MPRTRTFGTDWFGTLNTETAPHLIDAGHLQEAVNVSRDVRGALSPSASDTSVYQTPDHNIAGMKAVRYGGANHVIVATPDYLYVDNVNIGSSLGPSTHRFVCDGENVYILSADGLGKVWDGTTLRSFGPFGSGWEDWNDAQTFLVSNDDGTAAGLTGVYKWAASYRVTLESGKVLESKLYPLWIDAGGDPDENYSGSITLTATDGVMLYIRQVTQAEVDSWCADLGTGKVEGVFWRTKSGGVDYWEHSVVSQANIVGATGRYGAYDTVLDDNLGAEYLDADDAHGTPPTADIALISQRRLFLVSREDRKIYFSGIGQYDYFGPLDWIDAEDSVYGLAEIGESVAVAYASGIRTFRLVDGIEQWSSVVSSVGTTSTDSLALCDYGLLFARDDGLYLFDGNSVKRVSDIITPSWTAASHSSGWWRGAVVNGFGYYTNVLSGLAFEFKIINGVFTWSNTDNDQGAEQISGVSEDPLDGYIWFRRMDGIIGKLHQSTSLSTMTAKTKDYGDGELRHWDRCTIDASGDVAVSIGTNRSATDSFSASSDYRKKTRAMLKTSVIGELCSVSIVTTGTVYGVELETT